MEKYKNKYRIKSARHPYWNYSSNALYFVTICTGNRAHYFGEIKNKQLQYSEIGTMADTCWKAIPLHFPFVVLHNHVIMPNHMHGVIEIAKPDGSIKLNDKSLRNPPSHVETQNLASLPQRANPPIPQRANPPTPQRANPPISSHKNQFGPQSKNLASIIRGYKIGVTKYARKSKPAFNWQSRYHDHIIRNEQSYFRIQNYIANNPKNWKEDKFYAGIEMKKR